MINPMYIFDPTFMRRWVCVRVCARERRIQNTWTQQHAVQSHSLKNKIKYRKALENSSLYLGYVLTSAFNWLTITFGVLYFLYCCRVYVCVCLIFCWCSALPGTKLGEKSVGPISARHTEKAHNKTLIVTWNVILYLKTLVNEYRLWLSFLLA